MPPTAQQLTNNLYAQFTGNRPQQQQQQQGGAAFNLADFMRAISQNNMAGAYRSQAAMGPATARAGQAGPVALAGANQAVGAMNAQVAREQMPYTLEGITRQANANQNIGFGQSQANVYGSGFDAASRMYGPAAGLTGLREILAALPELYGNIGGAGGAGGIPNMTTPYGGGYQFT